VRVGDDRGRPGNDLAESGILHNPGLWEASKSRIMYTGVPCRNRSHSALVTSSNSSFFSGETG
jgi:hypothetical protein